ncbi:hypothetical protein H5410_054377 [Solanum commersonii]|uniref:Uncharacterized protein n=1 Tax=Solanum commersonii TaxID=4109 RepID=A0A9J5WER8_SOLCO|nr:hypothetical protein H5410_054377 [Solanum commersonii]
MEDGGREIRVPLASSSSKFSKSPISSGKLSSFDQSDTCSFTKPFDLQMLLGRDARCGGWKCNS